MKLNRSLAISAKFKEFQKANILGLLMEAFPKIEIFESNTSNNRNRFFSIENTLLTMILTASQPDKTLKNSVVL